MSSEGRTDTNQHSGTSGNSVEVEYWRKNPETHMRPVTQALNHLSNIEDAFHVKRKSLEDFVKDLGEVDGDLVERTRVYAEKPFYSKSEILSSFEKHCMDQFGDEDSNVHNVYRSVFGDQFYNAINGSKSVKSSKPGMRAEQMAPFLGKVVKHKIHPIYRREDDVAEAMEVTNQNKAKLEEWFDQMKLPRDQETPETENDARIDYSQRMHHLAEEIETHLGEYQNDVHDSDTVTYTDVTGNEDYRVLNTVLDALQIARNETGLDMVTRN